MDSATTPHENVTGVSDTGVPATSVPSDNLIPDDVDSNKSATTVNTGV